MTERIRLVETDGTPHEIGHLRSTQMRELGKKWKARAWVPRGALSDVTIEEGDTEAYVNTDANGDEFGGRLRDVAWDVSEVLLLIDSFERDMIQGEPTGDGTGDARFENADDTAIVQDAVDRVDTVQTGTLDGVLGSLSFRFAYVSPARMTRVVDEIAGDVAYRPDGTLDYVNSIGDDRTGTTLSPDAHPVDGAFQVSRAGDDRKVNKLVMLGAGEGPAQVQQTVTAPGFDASVDREKWGVYVNKAIADADTLQTYGQALVSELATDTVEVVTTIRGQAASIGDSYHLQSAAKNVDTDLRAVRVETSLSNDGRTQRVTFSNRTIGREPTQSRLLRGVKRSQVAVEGFTVPLPISSGPAWTSPTQSHRFSVPMPVDVIEEIKVDLQVRGLQNYDPSSDSVGGNYPENLDVRVNGSSLGLSVGDGNTPFQETVDLSGELTVGAINTVDLTSDRQARTYAVLDADLYRRMTGD